MIFSHWNTAGQNAFYLTNAKAEIVGRTRLLNKLVFRFWEISLSFWIVGFLYLLFGLMDNEL